jgi:hypothetical protein
MTVDNSKIGMLKYNESYCLAFQDTSGKMWQIQEITQISNNNILLQAPPPKVVYDEF